MGDIKFQFVASGHTDVMSALEGIAKKAEEVSRRVSSATSGGNIPGIGSVAAQAQMSAKFMSQHQNMLNDLENLDVSAATRRNTLNRMWTERQVSVFRRNNKRMLDEQDRASSLHHAGLKAGISKEVAAHKEGERRKTIVAREGSNIRLMAQRLEHSKALFLWKRANGFGGYGGGGPGGFTRSMFASMGGMARTGLGAIAGGGGRFAGSLLGNIGGMASMGLGFGAAGLGAGVAIAGTMAVGKGLEKAMDLQTVATRLAIQTRVGDKKNAMTPKEVQEMLRSESMRVGGAAKAEDIGEAAMAFITRSGDPGKMREMLSTMTSTMIASGTSGRDMGTLMGILADPKSSILGENVTPEEMQKAAGILIEQTRTGAVELEDLAGQLPKILSGMKAGGWTGIDALSSVGAMLQMGMTMQGSSQQGTTSMRNLLVDLAGPKGTELATSRGVTAFEGGKRLSFEAYMERLTESFLFGMPGGKKGQKLKLTADKLTALKDLPDEEVTKMLGITAAKGSFDERASRALLPLITKYTEVYGEAIRAGKSESQAREEARKGLENTLTTYKTSGKAWNDVEQEVSLVGDTLAAKQESILNGLALSVENSGLMASLATLGEAAAKAAPGMVGFANVLGVAIDRFVAPTFNAAFANMDNAGPTQSELGDAVKQDYAKLRPDQKAVMKGLVLAQQAFGQTPNVYPYSDMADTPYARAMSFLVAGDNASFEHVVGSFERERDRYDSDQRLLRSGQTVVEQSIQAKGDYFDQMFDVGQSIAPMPAPQFAGAQGVVPDDLKIDTTKANDAISGAGGELATTLSEVNKMCKKATSGGSGAAEAGYVDTGDQSVMIY